MQPHILRGGGRVELMIGEAGGSARQQAPNRRLRALQVSYSVTTHWTPKTTGPHGAGALPEGPEWGAQKDNGSSRVAAPDAPWR
ncbi:hypothetical protein NDU88_005925 [Pleurodeles waltl]|uniref:Uncharacterized protein n=1 Tax=Pleurodeles waltl TaxID=8319 RepID=A0AAV7NNU4_PLEWA|nr:hypothetical protein NDU88_005925 [Pleurodeles waltl]